MLLEKREAQGKRTPALDNKPELIEDASIIWKGFCELDDTRQSTGFSPCRISFAEIESWCNAHFIPFIEREFFIDAIIELDRVRMKDIEKNIEEDIEKKKGKK